MQPAEQRGASESGPTRVSGDGFRGPLGQRLLLAVFRTCALGFVLIGLLLLGGRAAWKTLPFSDLYSWTGSMLEFLFYLGVTWLAAGVVAPIPLWSLRSRPGELPGRERWGATRDGGPTSLMAVFLALLALFAVGSSGPVLESWDPGLALLERLDVWSTFRESATRSFSPCSRGRRLVSSGCTSPGP